MDPLVRGAGLCGALSVVALGLGAASRSPIPPPAPSPEPTLAPSAAPCAAPAVACPPRAVADRDPASGRASCLPLPPSDRPLRSARLDRLARDSSLATPTRLELGAQAIARLADRPDAYAAYQLPVGGETLVGPADPAGWGADEAEPAIGQGLRLAEPSLGLRIEAAPDAPVVALPLEGQQGPSHVVLVGELYGVTVATHAAVEGRAGRRDYLVLYGHLSRPGPDVRTGSHLAPDAVVGYVGDRGGSDAPALYLEVRQLRRGARVEATLLSELVRPSVSIPCDARNVLPLK